jgi:Tn3 transposase DDE domain
MVVLRGCLPDGDDLRSWSGPRSAWRILQAALVYVNTLMLQDVLAGEPWADLLTPAGQRGLTPLFWTHVRPYGEVHLDLATRLAIGNPGPGPAVIS